MSFSISISPTSGTGVNGYLVTVASVNNWTGVVDLSVSINPTASVSITPAQVTVPAGGQVTANVTLGVVIEASTLRVDGASAHADRVHHSPEEAHSSTDKSSASGQHYG